uniref:Odorant-binding protein 39 n=1 Tax=Encarsia formosa TaxID=32400 RepID=A0A514TTZ2_ENCFO|nr:odorant-binding protein 39 [Encarsia formosa]
MNLTVNLLDEECIEKSKNKSPSKHEDENSIDVQDVVEMNKYAVCLLKKSSIMDESGKVNGNFDIVKIVRNLYKKTDDISLGMAFILKSLAKCRYLSGPDHFTTATKIIKCLLENQEETVRCGQY